MNITKELAALKQLGMNDLRARYAKVFGETTKASNREFLTKRILWRMQSKAEGTLSERALRRAEELADEAYLRTTIPKMPAVSGQEVVREAQRSALSLLRLPECPKTRMECLCNQIGACRRVGRVCGPADSERRARSGAGEGHGEVAFGRDGQVIEQRIDGAAGHRANRAGNEVGRLYVIAESCWLDHIRVSVVLLLRELLPDCL
jgi:hypothetical protein